MNNCKMCGKLLDDHIPLCQECFFKELMWYYRNNPHVKEDIEYRKKSDGSLEEVEIIRGLVFKEDAFRHILKKIK